MAQLSTAQWWDSYYDQHHTETFEWYLPVEIVESFIRRALRRKGTENPHREILPTAQDGQQEEENEEYFPIYYPKNILHPGCGSSAFSSFLTDYTENLYNMDFSSQAIERLKENLGNGGKFLWEGEKNMKRIENNEKEIEIPGEIENPIPIIHSSSSSPSLRNFSLFPPRSSRIFFSQGDCRRMVEFSSEFFQMIFDKGTLDCIVLTPEEEENTAQQGKTGENEENREENIRKSHGKENPQQNNENQGERSSETTGNHSSSSSSSSSPFPPGYHRAGYEYLREIYRLLSPGGIFLCFSLYSYHERIDYFEQGNGEEFPLLKWKVQYLAIPIAPLEMPQQKATHMFMAVKQGEMGETIGKPQEKVGKRMENK